MLYQLSPGSSDEKVVDALVGTRKVTQETTKTRAAFWTTARPHPAPSTFPVPVAGRAMMFPKQNQCFVNDRQGLLRELHPGPFAP